MHRSRLCHFVIDVDDLDPGVAFWSAALDAKKKRFGDASSRVYRRLRLPDSKVRILLQQTGRPEDRQGTHAPRPRNRRRRGRGPADSRHSAPPDGITRHERGYDFWVLRDPWANEFCVLQINFPELLARQEPWNP